MPIILTNHLGTHFRGRGLDEGKVGWSLSSLVILYGHHGASSELAMIQLIILDLDGRS